MSASLYTCPRCDRMGFYFTGLQQHVCRGKNAGDERRRLTIEERAAAERTTPSAPSALSAVKNENDHGVDPCETICVRVKLGAATNLACAGHGAKSQKASSTSSGRCAAQRAAAKYFHCAEAVITLTLVTAGSCTVQRPELWMAQRSNPAAKCRVCGCTDDNCFRCIKRTGKPCHWVEPDLCSACVKPTVRRVKKGGAA